MVRRPWTTRSFGLLVAALASLATGLRADEPVLEDPAYRFHLKAPGPQWRLLVEAEIRKSFPAAVAGAEGPGGLTFLVIVDAVDETSLEALARRVADEVPAEGKEITDFGPARFADRDAFRWWVTGSRGDVPLKGRYVVFLHQGFLYQLIAFGPVATVEKDVSVLEKTFDSFLLQEGEVRARARPGGEPDADGVGWRVRGGRFESAAYAIALRPERAWSLVTGSELAQLNQAAEVGWRSEDPEANVILIADRAPREEREAFIRQLTRQFEANTGATLDPKPVPAVLDGRALALRRYHRAMDPPIEHLYGVLCEGESCYQVLASYLRAAAERAAPHVVLSLAGLRFLDPHEVREVSAALEQGPDSQNRVGPRHSLRRGVYRDFEHGLVWRRPPGFWRVRIGDDARSGDGGAILAILEPARGLWGSLAVGDPGTEDPATYHSAVASRLIDEPEKAGQAEPTALGEAPGLGVSGRKAHGDIAVRWRVVSALHRGRGYVLSVGGSVPNMKAASRAVEEAVRGLQFAPADFAAAVEDEDGTYRDERLGFALQAPGEGWKRSDVTSESLSPVGSLVLWEHAKESFAVGGICPAEAGMDAGGALRQLVEALGDRIPAASGEPQRSEATLADLPAVRFAWGGAAPAEAFVTQVDRTFYALVVLRRAAGAPLDVDELKARFRVLE